jgi:predicted secreted protein
MPSNAFAGKGTQMQIQTSSGESSSAAYTAISEINSITFDGMTRELIEVTSLDSVAGWREFIAGFRDGGNIAMNMNFTQAGYFDLLDLFNTDEAENFRLVLSDTSATTFDFAAWVLGLPINIQADDAVKSDVSLKVTGAVTATS